MASIRKNELKSGTSYRIVVKVKSQRTGKVETKSMTWKVPKDLNEDQIQKQPLCYQEHLLPQKSGDWNHRRTEW